VTDHESTAPNPVPDTTTSSSPVELPPPDLSVCDVGPDPQGRRSARQRRVLEHWGLRPDSDVLEIGCGMGRLAYALNGFLDTGTYTGFDVSAPAIAWLDEHYAPKLPNFRFDLIDVRNTRYNTEGGTEADEVRFPYPDASFDLVCAYAVLIHMPIPEVANYLRESRRVVRPGGTAIMSVFAVTDPARLPESDGRPFAPVGPGVYARQAGSPTHALAFDHDVLVELIEDAGWEIVDFARGDWRDPGDIDTTTPTASGDIFALR